MYMYIVSMRFGNFLCGYNTVDCAELVQIIHVHVHEQVTVKRWKAHGKKQHRIGGHPEIGSANEAI